MQIRRWKGLLVIVLLLAAGPAGAASPRPSDAAVASWVEEAIAADPRVRGDEMDVSVREGIVTLSGSAPTLASRKYAVMAARKIHGVLGVIDQLEMEVPIRADGDIAADARWQIERSSAIRSEDLAVSAEGGVVVEAYPYPWEEYEDGDGSEGAPDWDPYYFDYPTLPWIAGAEGTHAPGRPAA